MDDTTTSDGQEESETEIRREEGFVEHNRGGPLREVCPRMTLQSVVVDAQTLCPVAPQVRLLVEGPV